MSVTGVITGVVAGRIPRRPDRRSTEQHQDHHTDHPRGQRRQHIKPGARGTQYSRDHSDRGEGHHQPHRHERSAGVHQTGDGGQHDDGHPDTDQQRHLVVYPERVDGPLTGERGCVVDQQRPHHADRCGPRRDQGREQIPGRQPRAHRQDTGHRGAWPAHLSGRRPVVLRAVHIELSGHARAFDRRHGSDGSAPGRIATRRPGVDVGRFSSVTHPPAAAARITV